MSTLLANGWKLRIRQEECHDKLINAFKAGNKEFLTAAVCRFGKTITTLQALRDLADKTSNESQVIVVLCTMNVKNEWADAAEKTGFDKTYCCTPINNIDFSTIGTTGRHVIYVSTQKLGNNSDKSKELIEWFNAHEGLKTLVYDECHIGSGTNRTKSIIDALNFDNKVYLSGTPYRTHLRAEFDFDKSFGENKCYIYSMVDEREDYKNGLITDYIPVQLKMVILDYQKEIEETVGKDNDKFTQTYGISAKFFKKLFSDPSIKDKAIEFFNKIINFCKTKKISNGLFFVPTRKVGRDLVDLAKRSHINIKFMSLCGDQEDDSDYDMKESEAKRLNDFYSAPNPNNEIRIGVTCRKCGTGTTLKDLDFVAFLKDISNATDFIQQSQRCRTPKAGKEVAYVLCFNSWSGLKAFCDYARMTYSNKKYSQEEAVKKALENGALDVVLNLTEDEIDYDYFVDFMSYYHPGDEFFADIEFDSLEGFDMDAFLKSNGVKSFDELKKNLAKKYLELRDDPNFNNAKNLKDLNKALKNNNINESGKIVDIRKLFQEAYINVIMEMYYDDLSIEEMRDCDNYNDFIREVYIEAEMCMTLDAWKELNNTYSTYIPKVVNYLKANRDNNWN